MRDLKYGTSAFVSEMNKITDTENRQVAAKGEGAGGGMQREAGLADTRCIYKTGKQQGLAVEHREPYPTSYDKPENSFFKKNVYKCTESLCCTAGINTTW